MRGWIFICFLMLVPVTGATHATGCVPTSASFADVNVVTTTVTVSPVTVGPVTFNGATVQGDIFYIEDRNSVLFVPLFGSPIPFHSTLLKNSGLNPNSGGTWVYEETNFLPFLQRGGIGFFGAWFPPGCDQSWTLSDFITSQTLPGGTGPCLVIDEDPINDATCTHGPDTIIL